MDITNVILLGLLAISVIGNNSSVSIAVAVLLLVRLLHLDRAFPVFESYFIQVGIVILTIGVLTPVASGRIGTSEILTALKTPSAIIGLLAGILVAILGGRGVTYLTAQPTLVTGILLGTVIGVAFFKGVPVGPLIAAGGTGLILQLFHGKI